MIWEIDDKKPKVEGLDEDGKPDPQYAADLGLVPAPKGRRALSSIIEFAIYGLLVAPMYIFVVPYLVRIMTGTLDWYGFFQHPQFIILLLVALFSTIFALAFIIVQIALHGAKGVTIGKAMTGIRSVNVATLEKPKIGKTLLRALVMYLSFLVPVIGPALMFASVFFDSEKRGRSWLDHVGGTWFVDIKNGLNPYDTKRMRIARKTLSVDIDVEQEEALPSLASGGTAAAQSPSAYVAPGRTSSGVLGAARPTEAAPAASAPRPPAQQPQPSVSQQPAPQAAAPQPYQPGSLSGAARYQRPPEPVIDETRQAAPKPAVAPQQPTAHEPISAAPTNGETIAPGDLDDDVAATRLSPSRAAQKPAPVAVIELDNGDRFELTGTALLGRNPRPEAGEQVAHALPIEDPTQSISKTHLCIAVAPTGISVVDRHSTNGSALERGGDLRELVPGVPIDVQPGDVVRFGDRSLTFTLGDRAGA